MTHPYRAPWTPPAPPRAPWWPALALPLVVLAAYVAVCVAAARSERPPYCADLKRPGPVVTTRCLLF